VKQVTIYTNGWCPYCASAKELLTQKQVAFEEISIDGRPELRQAMIQRAGGRTSVPQIFIAGKHIGGCDDLHALDSAAKLDAMLA
jgi:glutaredoxin 3